MVTDIILGVIVPLALLILAGYLILTYRDEKVLELVRVAVRAAEQIYNSPGMGREKFDYVAEWLSKKFKISKEDLKNLIESAVYELNGSKNAGRKE